MNTSVKALCPDMPHIILWSSNDSLSYLGQDGCSEQVWKCSLLRPVQFSLNKELKSTQTADWACPGYILSTEQTEQDHAITEIHYYTPM